MPRKLPMPDFLEEDVDEIHDRMLESAPEDINVTEGDFFWDATRPSAEEKAEMTQLKLQNILLLAFPQTSFGIYLDFLGETKGEERNPATKSAGYIKVTGRPTTYIPKGTIFLTEATEEQPSIEFVSIEGVEIGETGEAKVKLECAIFGVIGNVASNSISLIGKPIDGIETICNPESFTGGTDEEDDESYRERVIAAYEESLSGSDKDYIRWAKQIPGVGQAYVLPEWEGPGTGSTKILILDSNGQPANEILIEKVQNYIAPPMKINRGGLAPVNANVVVAAPEVLNININVALGYKEGYNIEAVTENMKKNLVEYLSSIEITTDYEKIEYVSVNKIGFIILSTEGIDDYSGLTINNGTESIQIPVGVVPILGEVTAI